MRPMRLDAGLMYSLTQFSEEVVIGPYWQSPTLHMITKISNNIQTRLPVTQSGRQLLHVTQHMGYQTACHEDFYS